MYVTNCQRKNSCVTRHGTSPKYGTRKLTPKRCSSVWSRNTEQPGRNEEPHRTHLSEVWISAFRLPYAPNRLKPELRTSPRRRGERTGRPWERPARRDSAFLTPRTQDACAPREIAILSGGPAVVHGKMSLFMKKRRGNHR